MKAEEKLIDEIFKNNRALRVPFFQRAYVWEADPQLRLFVQSLEYVVETKRPYFMGSVILKSEESTYAGDGQQFLVIDGQQRMTTIAIFMKALHLILGDNDEFRRQFLLFEEDTPLSARTVPTILHSTTEDKCAFEAIIRAETPQLDSHLYTTLMADAFRYFCGYLSRTNKEADDNLSEHITPRQLLSALRNKMMVVEIKLGAEENEQQIFDTINSAGRQLTTAELLKNYLFASEEMAEQHKQYWLPIFEKNKNAEYWRKAVVSGRKSTNNIDTFFYALMLNKVFGTDLPLNDTQKKLFRHAGAGLFANYKQLVPAYINKDTIIHDIFEYGGLYMNICTGEDVLQDAIPQMNDVRRLYCFMQATQSVAMIPYLLYILSHQHDKEERARMFGFLESYVLRRAIVGSSNNSYSDLFSENLIGAGISTYEQLQENIRQRSNSDLCFPTDEQVLYALIHRDNSKLAQPILYMLETKLTEGEFLPYNSFTCLPMMPKRYDDDSAEFWPLESDMDEEERKEIGACLANWALYKSERKTLKKSIANSKWAISKLPELTIGLQSASQTNESILSHDREWNKSAIIDRAKALLTLINQAWPFDISIDTLSNDNDETLINEIEEEDLGLETVNILVKDSDTELPDTIGVSFWKAIGMKVYRNAFAAYMKQNGVTYSFDLKRMINALELFYIRIHQNTGWKLRYQDCKDVNEIQKFIQERARDWDGKFKYANTPAICLQFVEFLRRLDPSAQEIKSYKGKAKIRITDNLNGEQILDQNTALDYVIRKIGPDKLLRKADAQYNNSYLVLDVPTKGYDAMDCLPYYHLHIPLAKEGYQTIRSLMNNNRYKEYLLDLKIEYVKP